MTGEDGLPVVWESDSERGEERPGRVGKSSLREAVLFLFSKHPVQRKGRQESKMVVIMVGLGVGMWVG